MSFIFCKYMCMFPLALAHIAPSFTKWFFTWVFGPQKMFKLKPVVRWEIPAIFSPRRHLAKISHINFILYSGIHGCLLPAHPPMNHHYTCPRPAKAMLALLIDGRMVLQLTSAVDETWFVGRAGRILATNWGSMPWSSHIQFATKVNLL